MLLSYGLPRKSFGFLGKILPARWPFWCSANNIEDWKNIWFILLHYSVIVLSAVTIVT